MSENVFRPNSSFKEAVCIDAMRIFDSCSAQDCLEDLTFVFSTEDQAIIDDLRYIRRDDLCGLDSPLQRAGEDAIEGNAA